MVVRGRRQTQLAEDTRHVLLDGALGHDERLLRACLAQQVLGVARLPDDLDAGLGQQPDQPLTEEDGVLGYDGAHGISAWTTVPAPGALCTPNVPSTAATRSARPRRPE